MTRHLVLSDLHSNLEALEACLAEAGAAGYDAVLVLGDIVGYGPDPNPVVEALRALPALLAIRGNHDRVAAGLEDPQDFNAAARAASEWTRRSLLPANRDWLAALPAGPLAFAPGRWLAHGSPVDEDLYLLEEESAARSFAAGAFDLCFFGHTHHAGAFTLDGAEIAHAAARGERTTILLRPGHRYLINPGSLGQPRDRDPRAAYALYDEAAGTVAIRRVAYPIETTRAKIRSAGLPAILGDRLRLGA